MDRYIISIIESGKNNDAYCLNEDMQIMNGLVYANEDVCSNFKSLTIISTRNVRMYIESICKGVR